MALKSFWVAGGMSFVCLALASGFLTRFAAASPAVIMLGAMTRLDLSYIICWALDCGGIAGGWTRSMVG
jgi:hypothetical protein